MSRFLIFPVALACGLLLWFWGSGGFDSLAAWAAGEQREFQNQIARSLRAARAEQPEAVATLLTVCFAYGFFHAIGPGHGKVLIGGYGLGRRVAFWRLSAISVLSSLGQAVTAVVLVYAGVLVFQMSRESLVGTTEQVMAPISYGAIALIGLWLVVRSLRSFARARNTSNRPMTSIITKTITRIITTTKEKSVQIAVTAMARLRKKLQALVHCARP